MQKTKSIRRIQWSVSKKNICCTALSLSKKKFKGLVIIMFLIGYTPIGNPSKTLQLLCDLSIDKKRQDQRYIEKILLLQVKAHTEIRQKSKSPEKTISKMGKLPHGEFQFSETVTCYLVISLTFGKKNAIHKGFLLPKRQQRFSLMHSSSLK